MLHIEPDFWGHVQQHFGDGGAAAVPAAVASTGRPELARLPDTVAGFARALARLHDRYAPNVKLAYSLSLWGPHQDFRGQDDATVGTLAGRARRSSARSATASSWSSASSATGMPATSSTSTAMAGGLVGFRRAEPRCLAAPLDQIPPLTRRDPGGRPARHDVGGVASRRAPRRRAGVAFVALTVPDALADGRFDPTDQLALTVTTFTIAP